MLRVPLDRWLRDGLSESVRCPCSLLPLGQTRPGRLVMPAKQATGGAITIAIVEPIPVELSGVPETLLGNLGRRAAAARIGALNDPMAIEVVDRLDYDFGEFARGTRLHALRVATFDQAVRGFLGSHRCARRGAGDPVLAAGQRSDAVADRGPARGSGASPPPTTRGPTTVEPLGIGARSELASRSRSGGADPRHRAGSPPILPARSGPRADQGNR